MVTRGWEGVGIEQMLFKENMQLEAKSPRGLTHSTVKIDNSTGLYSSRLDLIIPTAKNK